MALKPLPESQAQMCEQSARTSAQGMCDRECGLGSCRCMTQEACHMMPDSAVLAVAQANRSQRPSTALCCAAQA
jgi:hypothetical protein